MLHFKTFFSADNNVVPQGGFCTKDRLAMFYFAAWSDKVNYTTELDNQNSAAYRDAVNVLQNQVFQF